MGEKINLQLKTNIKDLTIDGKQFTLNIDDPDVYQALEDFKSRYTSRNNVDVNELLTESEKTIDKVLGKGSCAKLFSKKDMRMYLLVNSLAEIYQDEFMKDENEKELEDYEQNMKDLKEIYGYMKEINKVNNYSNKKYARTPRRNKNRRK